MCKRFLKTGVLLVVFFVCCAVFTAVNITAFADTENKTAMDIIQSQLPEEERGILLNEEYHIDDELLFKEAGKNISECEFDNAPILRKYSILWGYAEKPLEEIVAENDKINSYRYAVFGDETLEIGKFDNGEKIEVGLHKVYGEDAPLYIKDLMEDSLPIDLQNVNHIYCFELFIGEKILYFVGEDETYVAYYSNDNVPAVIYSYEEFTKMAVDYYNYITSYEFNYDENGSPLGDGFYSLDDFLKGPLVFPTVSLPLYENPWFWTGICAGIFLVAGATVFFILKKRKVK